MSLDPGVSDAVWPDHDVLFTVDYEPLKDPLNEIRLLTLLPGSVDSAIKCEITTTTFPPIVPYRALSYECGTDSSPWCLMVNGQPVTVWRNLRLFLWQPRSSMSNLLPMVLWCDAICIDQRTTNEKNHQVMMMHKIYSHAQQVFAWLGEEDESSGELMYFLNESVVHWTSYGAVCCIGEDAHRYVTPEV